MSENFQYNRNRNHTGENAEYKYVNNRQSRRDAYSRDTHRRETTHRFDNLRDIKDNNGEVFFVRNSSGSSGDSNSDGESDQSNWGNSSDSDSSNNEDWSSGSEYY